ncbi:hypothetical protein [Streptomyces javensis]|uniref:Uncharacterized protein n=1 Tax=Streptomyces javensis TaxID=114698 RepID=A0ABN1X3F0_9ACTN
MTVGFDVPRSGPYTRSTDSVSDHDPDAGSAPDPDPDPNSDSDPRGHTAVMPDHLAPQPV